MSKTEKFNPFPGLKPFTFEDSDLFFGREVQIREVLDKLLKNRFVTITGDSGSGKTSLIFSGVLPGLSEKEISETQKWKIISFLPGNDPINNLAEALKTNFTKDGVKPEKKKILDLLTEDSDGLTNVLKSLTNVESDKILIVIDQFEEIFRYSKTAITRNASIVYSDFINLIVNAFSKSDGSVYMILSMRSDFIGECSHYKEFTKLINACNYLIPQMSTEDYYDAITGPVKCAGASIDPLLVQILLEDIGDRKDQLPVLQHVMMRTLFFWMEYDDPTRPIGFSDYDSVGGMNKALSVHADEVYEDLTLRNREICEILFKTITEKGTDNRNIRHPSTVRVIAAVAGCTDEELLEVIEKFRKSSRSFITPLQGVPLTSDSVIDISHECLIRLWDRLHKWVDEEAASVQMYLKLSVASGMYHQGKTSLLKPPDLQLALKWRDENKPTLKWAERFNPAFERAMVYIKTSEKEFRVDEENKQRIQTRRLKRNKMAAIIFGGAATIAFLFMTLSYFQKSDAIKQKTEVLSQLTEISVQKAIAEDNAFKANVSAEAALNSNDSIETLTRLALQREQEEASLRKIADQKAILAIDRMNKAISDENRAKEQEEINRLEKEAALKLRMVSVGKTMAVKSLQVQGQKDIQTLLAYQAFMFNKNNGGYPNDPDVYAGLYNVVKNYKEDSYKLFNGHSGGVNSIAVVPDKSIFYSAGSDCKILRWNINDYNQAPQVIYSGLNDIPEVLSVSPDANWLACGNQNALIRMIPLETNQIGFDLRGHTGEIKSLKFTKDGKYLYSAALDGKVLKWDLNARTSSEVNTLNAQIEYLDISSDSKIFAGISKTGDVIVWEPDRNSARFVIESDGQVINVVRFKPGEDIIALGDASGNIEMWNISTRTRISEVNGHNGAINDLIFNRLNSQMASVSDDRLIKIWDTENLRQPPVIISDSESAVAVVEFSGNGREIISGTVNSSRNLEARPALADYMATDICNLVTRNFTLQEWDLYVATDIDYVETCPEKQPKIKINEVKTISVISELLR